MLPVVVNVCLSVRGCYAYSATAAKLCTHYPSEKNLCSTNLCNMYMYPLYMYLSAACICICCKKIYMYPYRTFCPLVIPLKHALRVYAAHQRKREVNLVSVWSVLSDREGLYFWRLYGEIYKLIRAAFHTYMNFCFKQTLYFLSWLLCLMHLSLYAAACIFDLTNLHCYICAKGSNKAETDPHPT